MRSRRNAFAGVIGILIAVVECSHVGEFAAHRAHVRIYLVPAIQVLALPVLKRIVATDSTHVIVFEGREE